MTPRFHHKRVTRAVIAAAGGGTRLLPLTRITPKPLLPLVDRPLVDYAIADVTAAGITEVFVLYNESTFQQWRDVQDGYQLTSWDHVEFVAVQANGHHWGESLLDLKPQLENEPFALLLASELFEHGGAFLAEMITTFEETSCATVAIDNPESGEELISLLNIREASSIEAPPGTNTNRVLGRYVLPPDFLKDLEQTRSVEGRVNFFDALNKTANAGKLLGVVRGNRHWAIRVPLDYLLATVDLAAEDFEYGPILRQHLLSKVGRDVQNGGNE